MVDARAKQVKTMDEMTWKDALIFGIGQMLALIPGVSRSGGTITSAVRWVIPVRLQCA